MNLADPDGRTPFRFLFKITRTRSVTGDIVDLFTKSPAHKCYINRQRILCLTWSSRLVQCLFTKSPAYECYINRQRILCLTWSSWLAQFWWQWEDYEWPCCFDNSQWHLTSTVSTPSLSSLTAHDVTYDWKFIGLKHSSHIQSENQEWTNWYLKCNDIKLKWPLHFS